MAVEFSPQFEHSPVEEILAFLQSLTGVTIFADEEFHGEELTFALAPTTVQNALGWIARQFDATVRIEAGGVRLTAAYPELELRFHELESLIDAAAFDDSQELFDSLETMIRDQIDVDLWDMVPEASLRYWRDALLVTAPAETHGKIASLIAALERAYR